MDPGRCHSEGISSWLTGAVLAAKMAARMLLQVVQLVLLFIAAAVLLLVAAFVYKDPWD